MKLHKKLIHDLWHYKGQFFTIFLMTFIGMMAFAGIHAYMDGMDVSGQTFYTKNNLQDLWVTSSSITQEDLDEIKEIDHVKDANRALSVNAKVKGFKDTSLETVVIEENTVSKMKVEKGEKFSNVKNGAWLDAYFAKENDLNVGDTLKLNISGQTLNVKVKGLVNTPDHVYFVKDSTEVFPVHDTYGYVYVSDETFKDQIMQGMDVNYTTIYVDVDKESNVDSVKKKISNNIENVLAVTTRKNNFSYAGYQSEVEEGQTYSMVFTGMFIFIAILSVISTMNRFVKKQRVEIGTLKALGFPNRKIYTHYIGFGFLISVLAVILGTVIGAIAIGKSFLNLEAGYFEMPYAQVAILPIVYEVGIAIVLGISLVTYLSMRSVLKQTASQALRLDAPVVKNKNYTLTTKSIFKNAKLSTKWNLRDISRNKMRTLASLCGVAGCTILIVAAFGLYDSMNSYIDWEFNDLNQYVNKITLNSSYTEDEYNQLIEKYGKSTTQDVSIEFKDGKKKEVKALTINDSKGKVAYSDHNRNEIQLKSTGIYVTEKMAETYGFEVGDTIEWHQIGSDTWHKSKIVGMNRDPQNQQFNMTRTYYESLDETYHATSIYTNKKAEKLDGVSKVTSLKTLRNGVESMLDTMRMMIYMLIAFAIILGSVILYNLGVLSFTEKQYQFATLKVLGFQNKQIKEIFIKQNIWIMIVAIIIGLPLGYLMVDYIYKAALSDNYDFGAYIKVISYLIAAFGTFLVSYVMNKILARKINTIDMVTSLKGNE